VDHRRVVDDGPCRLVLRQDLDAQRRGQPRRRRGRPTWGHLDREPLLGDQGRAAVTVRGENADVQVVDVADLRAEGEDRVAVHLLGRQRGVQAREVRVLAEQRAGGQRRRHDARPELGGEVRGLEVRVPVGEVLEADLLVEVDVAVELRRGDVGEPGRRRQGALEDPEQRAGEDARREAGRPARRVAPGVQVRDELDRSRDRRQVGLAAEAPGRVEQPDGARARPGELGHEGVPSGGLLGGADDDVVVVRAGADPVDLRVVDDRAHVVARDGARLADHEDLDAHVGLRRDRGQDDRDHRQVGRVGHDHRLQVAGRLPALQLEREEVGAVVDVGRDDVLGADGHEVVVLRQPGQHVALVLGVQDGIVVGADRVLDHDRRAARTRRGRGVGRVGRRPRVGPASGAPGTVFAVEPVLGLRDRGERREQLVGAELEGRQRGQRQQPAEIGRGAAVLDLDVRRDHAVLAREENALARLHHRNGRIRRRETAAGRGDTLPCERQAHQRPEGATESTAHDDPPPARAKHGQCQGAIPEA
jgi:hypothetical protein